MVVEEVRHQAAIAGRVTDVQTGRTVAGAVVAVTAGPAAFADALGLAEISFGPAWASMAERLDRTLTHADGHFHFLDLPDGQYTLVASLPDWGSRYATAQANVVVARGADGRVSLALTDLALPATAIAGQVTATDSTPVVLAAVSVQGSGERVYSDGQGRYRLVGLEAGTRTLVVSAQGFQSATQAVQLAQAGAVQTVNVALTRAT